MRIFRAVVGGKVKFPVSCTVYNITKIKQKVRGGGCDRINITIGHNLVQLINNLLNYIKGKRKKNNNSNNTIMGGRQMDVWSGQ